jgi:hypothetical protein
VINFGGQPERGNLGMAVLAGLVVAIACALVWGVIAYTTKYQFSLAAILVGLAVGTVMARIGRVNSPVFAVASAALAVFGCALGSLVAEMLVLLRHGVPMSAILAHLNVVFREYPKAVGGLGFVFWVIAALYGYRIGIGGSMRWGWRGRMRPARQPYGAMNQPYGTNQPYAAGQQPYGGTPEGRHRGTARPRSRTARHNRAIWRRRSRLAMPGAASPISNSASSPRQDRTSPSNPRPDYGASISGVKCASVVGMPSSVARLSASASSRLIRPAIASLVSGGSAAWPSSSRLA